MTNNWHGNLPKYKRMSKPFFVPSVCQACGAYFIFPDHKMTRVYSMPQKIGAK